MHFNLLVIRTEDPKKFSLQYEQIGFEFDYHKHGNGPFHFASERNGFVFEIYPLTKSQNMADGTLRLGLKVKNIEATLSNIQNSAWNILSEIKESEWGRNAVIQDLDGRKIELTEE